DNFNGFCIVSSDSDFTKLASRIRESGLLVYGFGEKKTPPAFVSACDKFIYTEVLRARTDETEQIAKKSSNELKQDAKLVNLLRNAVEASSDESGWAHLAPVGSNIAKQSPDFDPRNYGYAKLGELVRATRSRYRRYPSGSDITRADIPPHLSRPRYCRRKTAVIYMG
ncbi:MAG: NYN domain-containing protein, partial [Acidihalobacter sp.]